MKMKKKNILMSMRKTGQRLFALLFAVVLTLTMLPQDALAYIGPIKEPEKESENIEQYEAEQVSSGEFTDSEGNIYKYIQNEYIHFDICVNSTNDLCKKNIGIKAHTVPTAVIKGEKWDLYRKKPDTYGYQIMHHRLALNKLNVGFVSEDDLKEMSLADIKCNIDEKDASVELVIDFLVDGFAYTVHNKFKLVSLEKGNMHSDIFPEKTYRNPKDKEQNWGVETSAYWEYKGETQFDSSRQFYSLDVDLVDFPKMGHANADVSTLTVRAQIRGEDNDEYRQLNDNLKNAIINEGLKRFEKES